MSTVNTSNIVLVNRKRLIEIAKNGFSKREENSQIQNQDKMYLKLKDPLREENTGKTVSPDKVDVVVVRNASTNKLSASPEKIEEAMRQLNEGSESPLYQLESIPLEKYIQKMREKQANNMQKDASLNNAVQTKQVEDTIKTQNAIQTEKEEKLEEVPNRNKDMVQKTAGFTAGLAKGILSRMNIRDIAKENIEKMQARLGNKKDEKVKTEKVQEDKQHLPNKENSKEDLESQKKKEENNREITARQQREKQKEEIALVKIKEKVEKGKELTEKERVLYEEHQKELSRNAAEEMKSLNTLDQYALQNNKEIMARLALAGKMAAEQLGKNVQVQQKEDEGR